MSVNLPDPVSNSVNGIRDIVLAVAFILLIALIGWLFWSRSSLQAEVSEQKTEISGYQLANTQCVKDVATAKSDLQGAITAGQLRQSTVADAITSGNAAAVIFTNNASKINASTPQGNDCTAAKKSTDAYFGGKK